MRLRTRVESRQRQRQRQRRRLWLITYIVMYVFMLTQRSTAAAARNALACKMALLRSCVVSANWQLATTNRGSYQLLLQWHELENSLLLLLCLSGACLDLLRGCGFLLARLKSQHSRNSRESSQAGAVSVSAAWRDSRRQHRATCHLQLSMRRVFGCSCSCYCCGCR